MIDHKPAPLPSARRAHVLAALTRDGVVRIAQLTGELGVAPVTLRRDLALMEEEGLLTRVHGGAVEVTASPATERLHARLPETTRGAIAVLVPSLSFYWPAVVHGMEGQALQHGLRLRVRAASYELQDERPVLERLLADDDVRGLIVAPNPATPFAQDVIDWLSAIPLPSVLVEREALSLPGRVPIENAVTDHSLGAVLAARHLADLGHRRVGLILSRDSPTGRKIVRGWELALAELGLPPSPNLERFIPPRTHPDFKLAVDSVLEAVLSTGVTGLLVHSDPEAMALIDLATHKGLSVPQDLSVVAYDDEVAAMFTPPLTAVRPPREAVGAAAVDLVVARMADPSRPVHRVMLNPTLSVRQSTARATARARGR